MVADGDTGLERGGAAMKITRLETIRLAGFPAHLWLEVTTDDGLVGTGETFYVPRAVEAVLHDVCAPQVIGRNPFDRDAIWADLFGITNYYGYAGAEMRAISALDIALWDIVGQAVGQPIYNLLGGRCRERIRTYNTCASYGDQRDFEAFHERPAELAESLLAEGITAMKIWPFDRFAPKTRGQYLSPEELKAGLRPVEAIRRAVGDRMEIAIECHALWNFNTAMRLARALAPYDIIWLEEPMTPDNLDELARLALESEVPICGSERLFTRFAFRQVLEKKAADIIMPDVIWTGGISEVKKIASMAEAYHAPIAPHDCTGPVTMFANLHLCANCPNAMIQESVRAFYRGYYDQIVTTNLTVRQGHLEFPTTPGLGTRLHPALRQRADASLAVSDEATLAAWLAGDDQSTRDAARVERLRVGEG
jgi:L-alanine-DL-glutamate epimerase-like enolase superfamily enzyme